MRTVEVLGTSYFHRQWGDEAIGAWEFGFSARGSGRELYWSFRLKSGEDFARGYLNSVRQRFEVGLAAPVSGGLLTSIDAEDGGPCQILALPIEGEPLNAYLLRVSPSLRTTLKLMGDLIAQLRELASLPRLISSVSPPDFLVRARHGATLEAVVHPVFAVLREEVSKTDFEIACFWTEYVSRVYAVAKDNWSKPLGDYDPMAPRTFRKLLKVLRSGKDLSMAEALDELGRCIRRELDSLRPSEQPKGQDILFPMGPLRRLLTDELVLEYPEKFDSAAEESRQSFGSPFNIAMPADAVSGESRYGRLLPAERWFRESLVKSVNRKMATPFLAVHPNTQRTRALYCEENFTLIVTDAAPGIPLPTLLEWNGGFETVDALRLAGKIRRALDQFDSAEFQFELVSPWQIEIYPLRPLESKKPGEVFVGPCRDWPAWEVRIRVEIPTESIIEPSEKTAWSFLLSKMAGKAFPALVAWLLEWRRLEWAAGQGALEREPISWDRRFNSLFTAAGDYFEPHNPAHRERFLALLREGYGVSETLHT